ncbi:MAG: arylesterase [Bosea sp. (in: a-proteobacteria)]
MIELKRHRLSRRHALIGSLVMGAGLSSGRLLAQSKPLKLVAFGDSLTAGYNLPADAAFPVVLQRELKARGHNITIVNAGVSGDTMSGGLERLDWSIPDDTDGVILELGANDALRGLDPAVTEKALDAILARLKARNIKVMLSGMRSPPNNGADYAARFDAIYRSAAQKYGLILDPFFLEGIAGDRSLNLADGIHPTAEGVRRIVARILPTVETFIISLKR